MGRYRQIVARCDDNDRGGKVMDYDELKELNKNLMRLNASNAYDIGNILKEKTKYLTCLQEIKGIMERLLEKGLEPQSVEHQLKLRGKEELASIILQKIEEVK